MYTQRALKCRLDYKSCQDRMPLTINHDKIEFYHANDRIYIVGTLFLKMPVSQRKT